MNTEEVLEGLRKLIDQHVGDEKELMQALLEESDTWSMRLEEIEADD